MEVYLDINELQKGTWSYPIKINEIDEKGQEKFPTLEETQRKINSILAAIQNQKGQLIQIVEVSTQGKETRFMEGAGIEKVLLFIVKK